MRVIHHNSGARDLIHLHVGIKLLTGGPPDNSAVNMVFGGGLATYKGYYCMNSRNGTLLTHILTCLLLRTVILLTI